MSEHGLVRAELDAVEADLGIRTFAHGDLILTVGVDHDERGPGLGGRLGDGIDSDSGGTEGLEHRLAVGVGADRTDHAGPRTESGSRRSLVRALSAGRSAEPTTAHGLTGGGKSGGGGGDVGVDAADDRQGTIDGHDPIIGERRQNEGCPVLI